LKDAEDATDTKIAAALEKFKSDMKSDMGFEIQDPRQTTDPKMTGKKESRKLYKEPAE